MKIVVKRDGLYQDYDFGKVKKVIGLAFNSMGTEIPNDFLRFMEETVLKRTLFMSRKCKISFKHL